MDNFFIKMFQRREATPAPISAGVPSSTTDPNAASNQPSENTGSYEEKIVRVSNPNTSLTISAVYRAIELKAKTIGSMEMQYQRKYSEKGNFVQSMWGDGRVLNWLMQKQANPIMTGSELFQQMSIHRELYGNAFVYIERDYAGAPKYLWLAMCGGYNPATGTYTLTYNTDRGMRSRFEAPAEDVIHWRNTYRHPDGYMGIPTHLYAIQTLSLIATEKQQAMETAAKGGRMKLLIGEEKPSQGQGTLAFGMFNKDTMDSYAEELQKKMYSGHDILAIRGLDKVQNISMSAVEMQMFEQMGATNDDVSRFFGVPRPLLMLDTNSHYNDYQNATMEFHTRTILPQKTGNEKEIYRKLIGFKDYGVRDIHICEDPLMVMDPERRAKVAQLKMQSGLCTVNEARQEFDMPSVNNGDVPLASANLMTLDALIAKSDAATQLKPGNYTVGEPAKEGEETV